MNDLITTEEETIAEYRRRHPKCIYCKHCTCVSTFCEGDRHWCEVKRKNVFPNLPRYFCPLFKVDIER